MLKFIFALLPVLFSGCNVILLPYTVPVSLAKDRVIHFEANVLDDNGQRLPDASVKVEEEFYYPNMSFNLLEGLVPAPLVYPAASHSSESTHVLTDVHFQIKRWTGQLEMSFQAPGFYPRVLEFKDGRFYEVFAANGRSEPKVGEMYDVRSVALQSRNPLSIILDRVEHPAELQFWRLMPAEFLDYRARVCGLASTRADEKLVPDLREVSAFPANTLYVRVERDTTGYFAIQHLGKDNQDIYSIDEYPRTIRLFSTAKEGGFIRIPTKDGRPIEGRIRTAPERGYRPELELSAADVRSLVKREPAIPFYLKTDKLYGRGVIEYVSDGEMHSEERHQRNIEVGLSVIVLLQTDGTRNVE